MSDTERGLFVAFDGPGGVGKSTTVAAVGHLLTTAGTAVHATTEPSRANLGEIARHGTETYTGMSLACLVAADRYHHIATEITPALERGDTVLCDRYVGSSLVLQRLDGIDPTTIWAINQHAITPDLTVVLTADPEVIHARLTARGTHSRFEKMPGSSRKEAALYEEAATFLEKVGYPTLIIDCTNRSPERVADIIVSRIGTLRRGTSGN
ncbi:dTMP kinase [Kitasatospora viridis]|uniref:Thymidylate kinase n=1 Tax=Kitasatospora viridis TaxID=281105 RepID=A0A561SA58_9ACTN|nr:dTMP kinase [Kitasatospora viridis]TWF71759.1 thymidylate kinase [Kitasatospora viridis]